MLLELTPERIDVFWPSIKEALKQTLPEGYRTERTYTNILEHLFKKDMTVFLSIAKEGDEKKDTAVAILLVGDSQEPFSGLKSLLIYALYGLQDIPDWLYLEDFQQLMDWAQLQGYTEVTAYSNLDRIIKIMSKLGCKTDTHFISYSIPLTPENRFGREAISLIAKEIEEEEGT